MSEDNTSNAIQIVHDTPPASLVSMPERHSIGQLKRRTIFDLTPLEFDRLRLMSEAYAGSSFNSSKTPQPEGDFLLIMLKGLELGIAPMAAVDTINIIAGKPVLDAKGMLALVKSSGLLENINIDSTAERCIVTIKRVGNDEQISSFTMEDARRFKTYERGNWIPLAEKANWKSQPAVMLKWRAVTAALREVFPDIISGLYNPEELDSDNTMVQEDGSMEFLPPSTYESPKIVTKPAETNDAKSEQAKKSEQDIWYTQSNVDKLLSHAQSKLWIEVGKPRTELEQAFFTLTQKTAWSDFESGKQAIEIAEAEVAKLSSAKPAEKKDTPAPATKTTKPAEKKSLSQVDMEAIEYWAMTGFNMTQENFASKVDLSKYTTPTTARTVIKQKAEEEGWAVVAEQATYNAEKHYIDFMTPIGEVRHYSRKSLRALVGDVYQDENGIESLPDGEPTEIEPLLITWKQADGYKQVVDAMPVMLPELA